MGMGSKPRLERKELHAKREVEPTEWERQWGMGERQVSGKSLGHLHPTGHRKDKFAKDEGRSLCARELGRVRGTVGQSQTGDRRATEKEQQQRRDTQRGSSTSSASIGHHKSQWGMGERLVSGKSLGHLHHTSSLGQRGHAGHHMKKEQHHTRAAYEKGYSHSARL
eukprot:745593-Heterocapsa_arctica.AAC.1